MNLHSLAKTLLYKAGYTIKKIRPAALSGTHTAGLNANQGDRSLMQLLHKVSPYEGFDFNAYNFDAHGWGGNSSAFRELIDKSHPQLIVEVGTWKGASALEMAKATRELGLDCNILCIDTWLGALEFWTDQNDPDRYQSLKCKHGFPTVYYQFLANVCHHGFQDRIIPFPQTASTAALWLRYYGIKADLIYLDASHEEEHVYEDLCNYWEILSPSGILFGDDYSWDGVRLAVDRFAKEQNRKIGFVADKWILQNPE